MKFLLDMFVVFGAAISIVVLFAVTTRPNVWYHPRGFLLAAIIMIVRYGFRIEK